MKDDVLVDERWLLLDESTYYFNIYLITIM